MRQIKFRAWDKEAKEMIEVGMIDLVHQTVMPRKPQGTAIYEYRRRDAYELMQFTGLHDKNGIDIYGGDIVSVEADRVLGGTEEGIGVVQWHEDGNWAINFSRHGATISVAAFLDDGIDLLGNEWENPDLLE